jgi:hypothetical protein
MADVFEFMGAAPAPGISAACFSGERERFGPADYKIWFTSEVSGESIGRGWSVPAAMIPPPVLAQVNELAGQLGYLPVDETWGTSAPPAELRVADAGADRAQTCGLGPASGEGPAFSQLLGERLRAGVTRMTLDSGGQLERFGAESFVAVWATADRRQLAEHWLVDLKARAVTFASQQAQQDSAWDIVGSEDAWEQVISGKLNLSVALRSCKLRYCDADESGPVASQDRIALLARLLALTSW